MFTKALLSIPIPPMGMLFVVMALIFLLGWPLNGRRAVMARRAPILLLLTRFWGSLIFSEPGLEPLVEPYLDEKRLVEWRRTAVLERRTVLRQTLRRMRTMGFPDAQLPRVRTRSTRASRLDVGRRMGSRMCLCAQGKTKCKGARENIYPGEPY
jgi:hypothetical protein